MKHDRSIIEEKQANDVLVILALALVYVTLFVWMLS